MSLPAKVTHRPLKDYFLRWAPNKHTHPKEKGGKREKADNDDYSRVKLAPLELDVISGIFLQPQYSGKENRGIKRHPKYTARRYLRKAKNET